MTQPKFSPLINLVANRIFPSANTEYREQFMSIANSVEGQRILTVGFTSKTANMKVNYEIGEFFGDLLVHSALANYLLQARLPELSPAFLTEAKNYIAGKSGQFDMFKGYELGRYLIVGGIFQQDYNPTKIDLHTHSDLVESLFYIIFQFGELMGRIGFQLIQNFFSSHMNENRTLFLERLTKSWRAQLETDMGKHYGTPELLDRIRKAKGFGYNDNLRFKKTVVQQPDGQYQVTLVMDAESAININEMVYGYSVLRFDGMQPLEAKTVTDTNLDKDYATSEAYMKMVNYFNSRGHNYGWRILFGRFVELYSRMRSPEARDYVAVFEEIIKSGLFPYAKKESLSNTDNRYYITYVRIEYLTRDYTLVDGDIYNLTDQVYYRYNKGESTIDPIINGYIDFYNDVIANRPVRVQPQAQQEVQAQQYPQQQEVQAQQYPQQQVQQYQQPSQIPPQQYSEEFEM